MEREAAFKELGFTWDMSTMFRELVDAVEHLVNFAVHKQQAQKGTPKADKYTPERASQSA